jgi:glycosyltransferase involved in cell wall biosynthesis
MRPRISVVTVSFNQAAFLQAAVDSVLNQSWPDKELIVVDPGSTDGSRQIIANYGARIQRVVLEPDRGAADGLNKGFAHAAGEILCFLNSDDEFLPGAFDRVAAEFERRRQADFISGCGYFIDATGARGKRIVPSRMTLAGYVYGACTVFQQGTFFRRHCYERTAGFNADNRTCWDGELFVDFLRAGMRHEVFYHDVANFRIHGASITGSGMNSAAYARDEQRIFAKTVGRARRRGDGLIAAGLRVSKLLRDPRSAVERLLQR